MTNRDISYAVAGPNDINDLEKILAETSMPGWITLSYQSDLERAPKMFPDGKSQSVIGRANDGALAGMASRIVMPCYWQGNVRPIGWIGNLRLAKEFRNRPSVLRNGVSAFRSKLDNAKETPWYLASILADNAPARRLFERGLPGFPKAQKLFAFHTLALRTKRLPQSPHIRAATQQDAAEIVRFINQQNQNRPLAAALSCTEDFSSGTYPNLSINDFLVYEAAGNILGTVAIWDQVPFRRLVVTNYKNTLRRLRALVNFVTPLTGLPTLPPQGQHLALAHLAFFTVPNGQNEVAQMLLDAARTVGKQRGHSVVSLGLAEDDPLLPQLSKNRHRAYAANIYCVTLNSNTPSVDPKHFALAKIEIALV